MGNVVEFRLPEISTDHLRDIIKLSDEQQEFYPWIFRSGKQVKVVFFFGTREGNGEYVTSPKSYEEFCDKEAENDDMEEKTLRNTEVVSHFIEHCEEQGIEIPDSVFESYFEA